MARITKQPRIITITLHSTKNKLLFLLPISNSLSSTSLSSISYNIPLSFNYVLAIFWLQHIERRLRFFVQQSITLYKIKCNKAKQNRILQALPLKCGVRIFRTSATSLPSFLSLFSFSLISYFLSLLSSSSITLTYIITF